MREESLREPTDEHCWPLEPLGGVEGDQGDAVYIHLKCILIRNKCRLLQEAVECIEWFKFQEAAGDPAQLEKVHPTLLALHPFCCKVRAETRLAIHRVKQLWKIDERQPRAQPFYDRSHPCKCGARTR